jgi:hypothetical protein
MDRIRPGTPCRSCLLVIAWRGALERSVVERAVDDGLGPGWRDATSPRLLDGIRKRAPLGRILVMPFVFRPFSVGRARNVSYGDAGRFNLLDVYHHRSKPEGAPVLVYFHGGGYYSGRKSISGRALLFRLASRGWVTISANYPWRPGSPRGRRSTLLHRARSRRLSGHHRHFPALRRAPPRRVTEPGRVRRAPARSACIRPFPFISVLGCRRWDRGVHGLGENAGLTRFNRAEAVGRPE